MQMVLEKFFERHCIVVLRVMRAVHEGYRSMASSHKERLPGIGVGVQFGYCHFLLPRTRQCLARMEYDSRFARVVVMLSD